MLEIINTGKTARLGDLEWGMAFMFKSGSVNPREHQQHGILYMFSDEDSYMDLSQDVGALFPVRNTHLDIDNSGLEVELYEIVKIQAQKVK